MVLNPQTANFPSFHQVEHGWSENLRAALAFLVPGAGVRSGLKLGIPVSGLMPALTDGYMVSGDKILGPYGSKLISPAPASSVHRLYFGLSGLYYGVVPAKANDVLLGEVSTTSDSVVSVAQPLNYGSCKFGVRGVINLAKCPKGVDTPLFTWKKPADLGLNYVRVSFALAVTAEASNTGATDNFTLKAEGQTIAALTGTNLQTAATKAVGSPAATWVFAGDDIDFSYNQVGAGVSSGSVEVIVTIEAI